MKKLRILTIVFAAVCALTLTSCGKTAVYSTEDYVKVSVEGFNGEAKAYLVTGTNEFYEKVNEDLFDGDGTDLELAGIELQIYDSVECSIDKKEGISNGDKITVSMTADNDRLKEYGVKFELDDYVYTVEGLKESVELDVWSDVAITYDGIAPNGSANVQYNGNDDFIKNNVRYLIDKSYGLSNGDEITVTASCSQSRLDENLYKLSQNEKKYTVEGLSYYADDLSGFDMSEIDAQLFDMAKEKLNNTTWSKAYKNDELLYGFQIMRDGSVSVEWGVTENFTIAPVKKLFYCPNGSAWDTYNSYTVFYELKFPCEKMKNYTKDEYAVGDKYELIVYAEAHMNNIIISDGKLDLSSAKTGVSCFGRDLIKNYLGLSLEETIFEHEDNCFYTDWKKTEIK